MPKVKAISPSRRYLLASFFLSITRILVIIEQSKARLLGTTPPTFVSDGLYPYIFNLLLFSRDDIVPDLVSFFPPSMRVMLGYLPL